MKPSTFKRIAKDARAGRDLAALAVNNPKVARMLSPGVFGPAAPDSLASVREWADEDDTEWPVGSGRPYLWYLVASTFEEHMKAANVLADAFELSTAVGGNRIRSHAGLIAILLIIGESALKTVKWSVCNRSDDIAIDNVGSACRRAKDLARMIVDTASREANFVLRSPY